MVDAVKILASKHPLPIMPHDNLRDPSTLCFRLVAAALVSLGAAGLIKLVRPMVWAATPEGTATVAAGGEPLTFRALKQYPSYQRYWKGIEQDNLRRKFLDLRFEHYASGRLLLFQGGHSAAAVLMAYAIEYHLKAALSEIEATWTDDERILVNSSHDLKALYQACLQRGLLKDSFVSFEFLEYASDHFGRRYPGREQQILSTRGYWRFGGSVLHTYDDCIVQLDRSLSRLYETEGLRLMRRALLGPGVSQPLRDAFLHLNIHAIEDVDNLREELAGQPATYIEPVDISRKDLLFAREVLPYPGRSYEHHKELLQWDLAAFFRYPKKNAPDPDPARLLLQDRASQPTALHYSQWAVDKAVERFGQGAVDVVEDKKSGTVVLHVFDRRAKKWHADLPLRRGGIELLVRSRRTEEHFQQWLAKVERQFSRRRRKLRQPPKRQ